MKKLLTLIVLLLSLSAAAQQMKNLEVQSITIDGKPAFQDVLKEGSIAFVWANGQEAMTLTSFVNEKVQSTGKLKLLDAQEVKATSTSFAGFTFLFEWNEQLQKGAKRTVPVKLNTRDTPDGENFILTISINKQIVRYKGVIIDMD